MPDSTLEVVEKPVATPEPEMLGAEPIHHYPAAKEYLPWGVICSLALHLTVVLFVAILAYLNHVKSLRELMTASANEPPPPPPQEMEVVLELDDRPPPTPNHIDWLRQQIEEPKPTPPPIVTPPPQPPKPQPVVQVTHAPKAPPHKPAPVAQAPTHTAPTRIVVGSGHFPAPTYPASALRMKIQGTVNVRISFDGSGGVADVEVISSSGAPMLDNAAKNWILAHWHDPNFAGQTSSVPIEFQISQ